MVQLDNMVYPYLMVISIEASDDDIKLLKCNYLLDLAFWTCTISNKELPVTHFLSTLRVMKFKKKLSRGT